MAATVTVPVSVLLQVGRRRPEEVASMDVTAYGDVVELPELLRALADAVEQAL